MPLKQHCLRWNDHQPNFISAFSSLLTCEALVDVTLAAEGSYIQAHKVVLSACSSYFQTLFTVNPCQHPIVILKDVQFADLKVVIDFMYNGEVNVSQEQLSSILKTAEMLKIKGLVEIALDHLVSKHDSSLDRAELVTQVEIQKSLESGPKPTIPSSPCLSPSRRRKRARKSSTGSGSCSREQPPDEQQSTDNELFACNVEGTVMKMEPDNFTSNESWGFEILQDVSQESFKEEIPDFESDQVTLHLPKYESSSGVESTSMDIPGPSNASHEFQSEEQDPSIVRENFYSLLDNHYNEQPMKKPFAKDEQERIINEIQVAKTSNDKNEDTSGSSNRFGNCSTSEIEENINNNMPQNTINTKKSIWRQFMLFCKKKNYELNLNTSTEELANILFDYGFNMKKFNGDDYKESVVKTIWNSTAKSIQEKYYNEYNRRIDPFTDIEFKKSRDARDAKRRMLRALPEKRKVRSIALTRQQTFEMAKVWSEDEPKGLIRKFYHIVAYELVWRGLEAVNCKYYYFKFESDNEGNETGRVEYNPLFSQTSQSGHHKLADSKWIVRNTEDEDICPVRLLKKLMSKRGSHITNEKLFLAPNPFWTKHYSKGWYKNSNIGLNELSKWTKTSAIRIGLDVEKVKIKAFRKTRSSE